MANNEKRGGYAFGGTLLGGLLLVYFLFPLVFALPLLAIYGSPPSRVPPVVGRAADLFFWPVDYLYEHVPPYHALIDAEKNWTGMD